MRIVILKTKYDHIDQHYVIKVGLCNLNSVLSHLSTPNLASNPEKSNTP